VTLWLHGLNIVQVNRHMQNDSEQYRTRKYNLHCLVTAFRFKMERNVVDVFSFQLHCAADSLHTSHTLQYQRHSFYPRDAMLARVIVIATCLSVRPSVRHAPVLSKRRNDFFTIW